MSTVLLAMWAALMAADRIDLVGGRGAFLLTPFIVLTPVVILSEAVRRFMIRDEVRVSAPTRLYTLAAAAFIAISAGSVLVAPDVAIGTSRVLLLTLNIAGTLAVAILAGDRRDLPLILARAALAWLLLCIVFDVAEVLFWTRRGPESLYLGPVLLRFGDFQTLGALPRLTGVVRDANRAGFMLLCSIVLIARGEPRLWLRRAALTVGVILLIATFSRSATLGALAALAVAALGVRRPTPGMLMLVPASIVFIAAVALVAPRRFNAVAEVMASPVSSRLTSSEGSAQTHLTLLERGLDEATSSPARIAIGLGYGNSHTVLQDFFPGNKYGSFHSMYVGTFAESGALALLLFLMLTGVPLILSRAWRPIIAGGVAFNLFYQTNTEPMFWFLLALAWMTISWSGYSRAAAESSTRS